MPAKSRRLLYGEDSTIGLGTVAFGANSASQDLGSATKAIVYVKGGGDFRIQGTPLPNTPADSFWARIGAEVLTNRSMEIVLVDPAPSHIRVQNTDAALAIDWWVESIREIA